MSKSSVQINCTVVRRYDDKSVFLGLEGPSNMAAFTEDEARRVSRAFSPVYVVKSGPDCYASYRPYTGIWGGLTFGWEREQSKAVRFTSKKAAREVVNAYPAANARIVRLK